MCQICDKLQYQNICRRQGIEPDKEYLASKPKGRVCEKIRRIQAQNIERLERIKRGDYGRV